ncbi:MAG: undecaprenyldiphospho-muramoylpentapeptide beta-N-acetylglucosaminyltransferase [Cryomorphaceae bacterium]|nr:undecaprenyldiphospho-muramoylpentapeptide beta-N-acetylglucosaminyltransferase [Cryomorphaceae bacterium]
MSKPLNILISGGGTGGHIFPAISIADELKARYKDAKITFVGSSDRMEMQRVPAAGYPIIGLWISGIQRKLSVRNVLFPLKVISSLIKSFWIISKYKPAIVIGTGGFASGPLLYVASLRGVPTVIQEQNSFPGITNKLLSKRAKIICVAYEGMDRWFPADKIIHTGNPIRQNLLTNDISTEMARESYGLHPQRTTILVTGGSLGAAAINTSIDLWIQNHFNSEHVQVIWQCGKLYAEKYLPKYANREGIWINPFIDDMSMAYRAADVVIARAGAGTLSELCATGKTAMLIPSPWVAEDHQRKNADSLAQKDAAVVLDEKEIQAFPDTLGALLSDPERRKTLAENAKKLAKPEATREIVNHIESLLT